MRLTKSSKEIKRLTERLRGKEINRESKRQI